MKTVEKIAGAIDAIKGAYKGVKNVAKASLDDKESASHVREVGALGALAAPSAYNMATGKDMNNTTKNVAEVGGLGALAAPYAAKLMKLKKV